MSKPLVLFLIAVSLLCAMPVFSSPGDSAQVRVSYGAVNKAPDHLVYAFLLRYMATKNETETDFAISIVRERMKFESPESAMVFLDRLLEEGAELASSNRHAKAALICNDYASKSNASLYSAMDSLDDRREDQSKNAYQQFKNSLSKEDQANFKTWIDDVKESYTYTAFDHASLFENRGIDVNIHVQQLCLKNSQKLLEEEQQ